MMSTSATDSSPPLPGRGIQPLDSLHSHARMVVLIFLAVTLLGLPVVFIKGQPSYQSTATIQVSPRYMKTLHDDIELEFQSNTQYLQFIEQQARTVNRYDIIELALQRLTEKGGNPWIREGESDREAIERLQRSLAIRHVRNTYLIQVSLVTGAPDGVDDILNAVVATYLERARKEQFFAADQRVENLQQRESELLQQIESITGERTQIAQELGVTAFNPDEVNAFDRRVRQMQEEYQAASTRRMEAQARLDAFLAEGETDTAMRSVQESLLTDPGLNSLRAGLNDRRAELLAATSGLSADHPAYLDAQDELQHIEQAINSSEDKLRESLRSGIQSRHRTSTSQARSIETELEQMLAEVQQQAGAYAAQFNRAVSLNNHLSLLWKELDRVRDRLNFFAAEDASPGFSHLVTAALPPLYPTGVGKKKLLLMVLVAAMVFSLLAPILIDFLDRRVRTVNDVHRILGFPPLGWIVNAVAGDSLRFAEDQVRRLASGIIRDGQRNATRVIVISSVRPGGGATWIARSLTRSLNRLGFPTLAVEANAYHPDSSYGPGPGLTAMLETGFDPTQVNNSDAEVPSVPVGSANDSRVLHTLQGLQAVLQAIPSHYNFVIVDAPPLLASADAELILSAGDAVLLVTEAGGITRGELSRAGRLLKSIDPPVVGTVVNRISPFHGGGYVTTLMEEHRTGSKVQSASLLNSLRPTVNELLQAPFALLRDALSACAFPHRGRSSSASAAERDVH